MCANIPELARYEESSVRQKAWIIGKAWTNSYSGNYCCHKAVGLSVVITIVKKLENDYLPKQIAFRAKWQEVTKWLENLFATKVTFWAGKMPFTSFSLKGSFYWNLFNAHAKLLLLYLSRSHTLHFLLYNHNLAFFTITIVSQDHISRNTFL